MASEDLHRAIFWTFLINLISEVSLQCTGGTTSLTASDFIIGTITYPTSGANYNTNLDLCWRISANQGIFMSLTSNVGAGDYIRVYNGTSTSDAVLLEKTDKQSNTHRVLTSSDSVFLRFTSDGTLDSAKDVGFTFQYVTGTSTACNTALTADATVRYLSSPNFPNPYDASTTCISEITAASGNVIQVNLIFLGLENDATCQYDSLQFVDTDGTGSTLYCGTDWTPTANLLSKGSSVEVKLKSDTLPKYGYIVSYQSITVQSASSGDTQSCDDGCKAGAAVGSIAAATLATGAGVAAYKTGLTGKIASKLGFKPKVGNVNAKGQLSDQKTGNLEEQDAEPGTKVTHQEDMA